MSDITDILQLLNCLDKKLSGYNLIAFHIVLLCILMKLAKPFSQCILNYQNKTNNMNLLTKQQITKI